MKYYVVSDVHGHYSILHDTLEKAGFFSDTEPHKLAAIFWIAAPRRWRCRPF